QAFACGGGGHGGARSPPRAHPRGPSRSRPGRIYDQRPEVAAALAAEHGTHSCSSLEELLGLAEVVVLAVPTYAHARIGVRILEQGLHLLVEKPMAATLEEADQLVAAARARNRVLGVGHVEFYNPAVQALMSRGEPPRFIEVQRLSAFTPRSLDVDVVLDLMIHDLQILHALDPSPVTEIRATGIDVLSSRIDIANARIELASGLVANITASRVSAEGVRKLRVFQPNHYFSIDYRQQEIKGFGLKEAGEQRLILPEEIKVHRCEPLRAELEAFLAACRGEKVRYVDGVEGRRALATALAVVRSIG
ncbi:MAG: Gfo/Idh/MocA family oxidoreductase, partial [Thermoanaerobaculia bacterium]|nr:Gfo/Idh/MocA family oxidoreductase [Thermoanaerobaculia bacterium]